MQPFFDRLRQWWAGRRARKVSYEDALQRARRGAAYLDGVDPGWHGRIDLVSLELASGTSCVLGQLHGEFRRGLSRARLWELSSAPRASLSPVAYGFRCVNVVDEALEARDYVYLNQAWGQILHERQAEESPL